MLPRRRPEGALVHLDLSGQRRSLPQPDRHDADRPRQDDVRDRRGADVDAAADLLGHRRSGVRQAPGAAVRSIDDSHPKSIYRRVRSPRSSSLFRTVITRRFRPDSAVSRRPVIASGAWRLSADDDSPAGDSADDQVRLGAARAPRSGSGASIGSCDRSSLAGEEPTNGRRFRRHVIADRAAQHRILPIRARRAPTAASPRRSPASAPRRPPRQVAQMGGKADANHGSRRSVCTSTDTTGGRSRTIAFQVSPRVARRVDLAAGRAEVDAARVERSRPTSRRAAR